MAKTIVGSFDNFSEAQRVVTDLVEHGFDRDDISIVANNAKGEYANFTSEGSEVVDGTAKGALTGGAIGGVAGLLAGLAGLAIPGIGPIIAAGPLAAALAGAGVGAVAGGLIGALTHLGVPDEDAHYYAESVRRGGSLVTVKADDMMAERATEIMHTHGAIDIDQRASEWEKSGWKGFDENAAPYSGSESWQSSNSNTPHQGVRVYEHDNDDLEINRPLGGNRDSDQPRRY